MDSTEGTFGDHLEALRPHLIRSAAVLVAVLVAAFLCKGLIVDRVLFGPMQEWFPTNRLLAALADATGVEQLRINDGVVELVSTTMAGQLNLHIKIAFYVALVAAFPYMLWEVWRFVRPALTERELAACRSFVGWVSLCFFSGVAFGYVIIAPLTVNFLSGYRVSSAVENMIDVNSYLSTIIDVTLACGAIFQLPLLVWFLARMGLLTAAFMRRYRRHAIVILTVVSAVITPPDVVSTILVIMPLYGLYELSIAIARRAEPAMP
ncbi:MAG: twin-arginine translocase subunit TatC [Alistipes sp.]|nr:twin-arginine translocase subunit TatC [Alistipes sp.]